MIDINKEAEEYSKSSLLNKKATKHFIAGHNSKATQAKVIQRQIDVLTDIKIAVSDKNPFTLYNIANKIQELKQQLKQLENGK